MVLAAVELPIGIVERDPELIDRIVKLEPGKDFSFTRPVRRRKSAPPKGSEICGIQQS